MSDIISYGCARWWMRGSAQAAQHGAFQGRVRAMALNNADGPLHQVTLPLASGLRLVPQLQVLQTVIGFPAVLVVHILPRYEGTFDEEGHHKHMFQDIAMLVVSIDHGFTLLLQEDRYAPFVSDTNSAPENVSGAIPTEPTPEILSDTNGTQERLADRLHMQRLPEIVSDTIPTETASEIMSDINGALPAPLDTADADAIPLGVSVAIALQSAEPGPAVSPRGSQQEEREAVLTQIDALQSAGLSLQKIADHLNAAHMPTFSGKGTWKKGTIGNLLAAQRQAAPVA